MLRELKDIERGDDAVYLRFTQMPIAKTKSFADGEVNVDLDDYDEVVGIEVLSLDPEEMQALAEIAASYKLSFDLWRHAVR